MLACHVERRGHRVVRIVDLINMHNSFVLVTAVIKVSSADHGQH
jgi:hypothetical protein